MATTVVEDPAGFIAAVQAEYMALPPWFPSDDCPDALMRVRTAGVGPHPVPEALVTALAAAGPAIAAAAAFVVPLTVEEAGNTVKSFPECRLTVMQGTQVRERAGEYCGCDFCGQPLGTRAFRCPTCKTYYHEIMIACEECDEDIRTGVPAPGRSEEARAALDKCRAAGHVREFLDFADVPTESRACNLCEESIPVGPSWVGAGGPADPDLCMACAETHEGVSFIAENGMRLRTDAQLRGMNEALGPGPFGTWVPILRGVEVRNRGEDDYVDDDDVDDVDDYNEYAEVWVNLDPESPYPVMISIADDHGRQGFFGLKQPLQQLLESLSQSSPVRIVDSLDYPIYYG
jgi:hypothetical protein